jgi:hypothetical protein
VELIILYPEICKIHAVPPINNIAGHCTFPNLLLLGLVLRADCAPDWPWPLATASIETHILQ